jgi:dTMP kinase
MIKKKNLFICFVGIDGSGKTTLAQKVTSFLNNNSIPASYVYGRFQLVLTKPIVVIANKIFLKRENISTNYNTYSNKKKKLFKKNKLISSIYRNALLFDYFIQLIIKIKIPLICGKNIVCDRYIFDTIITDMAIDMNFSTAEMKHLIDTCLLLLPKPDITFIVDVNEEIAFSRKSDVPNINYLKDRRRLYLEIGNYYNMIKLNGNEKADDVYSNCTRRLRNEFNM